MRMLPILALLLALAPATALAGEDLLQNGDFGRWQDGLPLGWTAEVAAWQSRDPSAPSNHIVRLEENGSSERGVASHGDAQVLRWRLLKQAFPCEPGACYRVAYETSSTVTHEGGQYDNCWIGVFFLDAQGRRLAFPTRDVRYPRWHRGALHVKAPKGTAKAEVAFFCSISGWFRLRHLRVERLAAEESFGVLVEDMDREYSFFAPHGLAWRHALTSRYERAAREAATPTAFADAIAPMLASLQDPHVWIDVPGEPRRQPHAPEVPRNFELPQVVARIAGVRQVIRNVLAGRTKTGGYGYLAIGTMQGTPQQLEAVDLAWRSLFDAPGIVLDLRVNGGGQETWGQRLMGCLTSAPVHYGRSKLRAGPKHTDFRPGVNRHVPPRTDARYEGPVVVLVGPGCISSGEAMAMMAKALPQVTVIGLRTRGASGNPQPVHLPNGVSVWYSRWIPLLPDGTPLERRGVEPDVRVEHVAGTDATFDKALEILGERVKAR